MKGSVVMRKEIQEVLKEKELIIFDLDGTLIDSLPDLHKATNYALELHRMPKQTIEHTRKSIGNGVAMLIRRSVPKLTSETEYKNVLKDFETYYSAHSSVLTYPYIGMKEALTKLKFLDYKLAVSTNKLEDVARVLIEHFFPNLFDTVCGDDGVRAKKPAPDSIMEIQQRLDIFDKNKIVYIGDSDVDYQTSINSHLDCILTTYGYRTENELKDKGISNVPLINKPLDLVE